MNCAHSALSDLTDAQLLDEVKRLADRERVATADLIGSLAELDARKLYLTQGYASLFTYCTQALGYSEDAAYARITAARAAVRFPAILDRLATGGVTLTAVRLLAPHLTPENYKEVLDAARGKSKRQVEEMVAWLQPRPDVQSLVRKLPAAATPAPQAGGSRSTACDALAALTFTMVPVAASAATPATADDRAIPTSRTGGTAVSDLFAYDSESTEAVRSRKPQRAVVAPLAPERYKVQFTVSAETRDRLRRAQDLLRHSVPDGDLATIFDRALVVLLERLERTKWAATKGARPPREKERGERRRARGHANRAAASQPPQLPPAASGLQPVPEQVDASDATHGEGTDQESLHARQRGSKWSRRIPSEVKRAVWKRDGGQCAFVGTAGRCGERARLEFHHLVPHADGGTATVDNLQLRCITHHRLEGERWFGMVQRVTDA